MEWLAPPKNGSGEQGEIALLQERLDEAADGVFIRAADIEEWLDSWFCDQELPPPDPDLITVE